MSQEESEPGGDTRHAAGLPSIRDSREKGGLADRGKSQPVEALMPGSQLKHGERRLQREFSFPLLKLLVLLPLFLVLEGDLEDPWPNRTPRPPAFARVQVIPLPLPSPSDGSIALAGLFQLRSTEPRFGGLSALAVDGGNLIGLTDTSVVIRWPKAGGRARFQDLPGGPGLPHYKNRRDSEALVRDPAGRGWWVAFEQKHNGWLFDTGFQRVLEKRPIRLRTWWRNWGIEAMLVDERGRLLLLPENGGTAIRWTPTGSESRRSLEAPSQIADAARLHDGRTLVALRSVRPWGISNSLGWIKRAGGGYEVEPWGRLPLGRWDNVEGLAAEPGPNGGVRLWLVTDNDFARRTLLIRVDLGPAIPPQGQADPGRDPGH